MFGQSFIVRGAFITQTEFDEGVRFSQFRHALRLWLAKRLARQRLNQTFLFSGQANPTIMKARTVWGELLAVTGNVYLRLQKARSEVLPRKCWLLWECEIAKAMGRSIRISSNGKAIERDFFQGQTLAAVLHDRGQSSGQDAALRRASKALRELHGLSMDVAGSVWHLSHGDATCHNVLIDSERHAAEWIDFDMRHRLDLSKVERHADDLRALMFSSCSMVPSPDRGTVARVLMESYGTVEVLDCFKSHIERCRIPTAFELAQGPLISRDFRRLRSFILNLSTS